MEKLDLIVQFLETSIQYYNHILPGYEKGDEEYAYFEGKVDGFIKMLEVVKMTPARIIIEIEDVNDAFALGAF